MRITMIPKELVMLGALVTAFMVILVFAAFVSKRALQQGREFSAVLQRGMMLATHVLKFRKSGRFPQRPLRVKP